MENVNIPLILNSSVLSVIFTVCIYYYFINKKNDYMQYILHGLEVKSTKHFMLKILKSM